MSLLRKYYETELQCNGMLVDFSLLTLEDRQIIAGTLGYQMYVAHIEITNAYNVFKESVFNAIDNRVYKWLVKMYFKYKER